jgi:pyrophosphatase PpaX
VRYRAVFFDLDGTLIDSGQMILASMRHATLAVTGRELTDEEYRAGIGTPLVAQMQVVDPARVDELVRVYSEHNAQLHEDLVACAGVFDVIARLHAEGRQLAIVTAKRRATVTLAAAHVPELEEYFDVVVAAEDTERHKPHPDPILFALEHVGADPSTTAYVGDSPFDVRAGKAAGVTAIAVTWGAIHDREQLARELPDAIVDTPEELLGRL